MSDSMETVITREGVNDGLRRCYTRIAECDERTSRINQQIAALLAEKSQVANRRARFEKAREALDGLRLILESEAQPQ